jgi:hypothetical protein
MRNKPTQEEINSSWELVKEDFLREDGLVDWDKIKEFIHSFHIMEEEVSKVYMTITNGKMSKPNYYASDVISQYEEELNKMFIERPRYINLDFAETEDWVAWALDAIDQGEEISDDEKLIAQYHSTLFNYIENHKMLLKAMKEIMNIKNAKDARKIAEEAIERQDVE